MTTTYATVDCRARLLDVTPVHVLRQAPVWAPGARVVFTDLEAAGNVRSPQGDGSVVTGPVADLGAALSDSTDLSNPIDPAKPAVSQQTASGTRAWSPPV